MSWNWHCFPSAEYFDQVTKFLYFVSSHGGRDNFRWVKPTVTTTEAPNHAVGEQNILWRLWRPVLLRMNTTIFSKNSPTGCESEGSHPNFCEAQLLFCVTEPTETCYSVKRWHQDTHVLPLPSNSVALEIVLLVRSHIYSVTVKFRLVWAKEICITVVTSYRTGKLLC